ncbi:hypothetical protein MferCBS31731_006740 [Microsporum ferrugineum]
MGIDSQQSSFTDDAPPSDSDSYFSNPEYLEDGRPSQFAKYPMRVEIPPFTLSKRIFYWTESNYQRSISRLIQDRLEITRVVVNRFPTQEETDALVSQASFMQNMPHYGGIIGLAVGSMIAKSKNATAEAAANKAASQQFTPNRSLFKLNPGEMKGRFIRASFILPIFAIIGTGIGEVIGEAYTRASAVTDPRFARLRDELSHADRQEIEARLKRYQAERLAAAHRRFGNVPPATQPQRPGYQATDGTDSPAGYSQPDSKVLRETYRSQGESPDYLASYSSANYYPEDRQQQQAYPSAPSSSSSSTDGKSFWDDDASPVNSDFASGSPTSSPESPSGSAWARIRQQSMGDSSANSGNYNNSSSSTWQRR